MLNVLRKRIDSEEDGFTLIELMVVVMILAILMAIAIPTFLGAQDKSKDRSAQSDLTNGIVAAKTLATDCAGSFYRAGACTTVLDGTTDMVGAEAGITFGNGVAAANTTTVGVLSTGTAIVLLKQSKAGSGANSRWYGITASASGVVDKCFATGATLPATINTAAGCVTVAGASHSNW